MALAVATARRDAEPLRVVMLATGLTGYLDAKFRALVARGVELFVITQAKRDNVAYERFPLEDVARVHAWHELPTGEELDRLVDDFAPHAILVHSWHIPPYRDVLKGREGQCLRVCWMDNNWLGTPRQWVGRATSRWFLRPMFDAAMVPCERTETFARHLGFAPDAILRGSLCADTDLYGAGPWPGTELAGRGAFLSALRMVHHKGADVLADAYRRYRAAVAEPWELHLAGVGPLEAEFDGVPGVVRHGFVQPRDLAGLFHRSSAYVNPSLAEPYGVVLHEATAAGLPVITSDMVGAAPTMVQDGVNGFLYPTGDAAALADRMARTSTAGPERLEEMSAVSKALSMRLSPASWARNLEDFLRTC
ncbi:glycosyltransferase family 4 protein [Nocardioides sp. BYT-33-1]|uniref:glycosyltransferase family 4 protein n=1 Tax=Nocardioides sp. BYT-33-1 TaxID=3416952 RepID=UPI003F53D191